MSIANSTRKLIAAVVLVFGGATAAQASIVIDYSPDTTGAALIQSAWTNRYGSQIVGDQFTLGISTTLTGASIFSNSGFGNIGDAARFLIFGDVAGVPAASPLFDIATTIDAIDSQLTTSITSLTRKHASISGILLSAGTYWFALAGDTGVDLTQGSGSYGDGIFYFGATSLTNQCSTCGDAFFTLESGAPAPAPATLALLSLGLLLGRRVVSRH